MPLAALSPARSQHRAAGAGNKAPQREIGIEVGARGRAFLSGQAILNCVEGLDADQSFVHALSQRDVPIRRADEAGIDRPLQHLCDARIVDPAFAIARKFRTAFKEALHLGLALEATARVAFKRFTHDRRLGLLRE
ncbi:MAG: hypothetical protein AB7P07_03445 [Hyphomonadaceae bacterium]